jgi:hypothetical protein
MATGAGTIRSRSVAALLVLACASPARAQPAGDDADLALSPLEVRRHLAVVEDLHRRDQLYREIGVLEELRLFAPTRALAQWARVRIATAYQQGAQYGDALAAYDGLLGERSLDGDLDGLVRIQRALALVTPQIDEPGHPGVDAVVAELEPLSERSGDVGFLASYQRARLDLVIGDGDAAARSIELARARCGGALSPCAAVASLAALAKQPPPRHRNPWLALAMSAVIPGVGSMYARHWVDGAYYLGLTGLAGLGALDVYDRDRSAGDQRASFYGLATLAATFYLANLVHAFGAAGRFNRVEAHRWAQHLWTGSDLPLPLADLPAPR